MSLILDALRKLEREKSTGEPGVVVVGTVPWGGARSRRPLVLASAAALVLLALAAGGLWLTRRTPHPKVEAPPATPSRAPGPSAIPSATRAGITSATPAGSGPANGAPAPREVPLPVAGTEAYAEGEAEAPAAPAAAPAAPQAPAASSDDVRLNAISRRDGRPVALINDRLVYEGDSFDGIKVLRIGDDEVEVEVRGKRRVLRF